MNHRLLLFVLSFICFVSQGTGQTTDTTTMLNSALIPVPKLEEDSYDWWERHKEVLRIKDSLNPEIILIGNSITHFWGGLPTIRFKDGQPRTGNGPKAWESVFGKFRVLNLGFGWDRTQNVLWRLDHGEIDGLHPKLVVLKIGTNNTSETVNARQNTPQEIVEGIARICERLQLKVPNAKILLMAVLPREELPTHPRRLLINKINEEIKKFALEKNLELLDIGPKMLTAEGKLDREIAPDFCHPSEKGYHIWANELKLVLERLAH